MRLAGHRKITATITGVTGTSQNSSVRGFTFYLERKYAKSLPADCFTMRFSIGVSAVPNNPLPQAVYDQFTFEKIFRETIRLARHYVLIESAYLTVDGVRRFGAVIEETARRNIPVCTFVQEPAYWARRDDPNLDPDRVADLKKFEAGVQYLRSIQAHVTVRTGTHAKTAVTDGQKVLTGSLNSMSYTKYMEEEVYYYIDPEFARATMKRRRLTECIECRRQAQLAGEQLFVADEAIMLGLQIKTMRQEAKLSQGQLALFVGTTRETISDIETGKVFPRSDMLFKIYKSFNRKMLSVPENVVPAVKQWVGITLE